MQNWNYTRHGVINGATQRFWGALGDDAGRVAARINNEPEFVQALADFARAGLNKEALEAVPPAELEPPASFVETLLDGGVGKEPPSVNSGFPFLVVASTQLDAVAGKETARCFASSLYTAHRDRDLNDWLKTSQPDTGPCAVSTLEFLSEWTFVEAARIVLGVTEETSQMRLAQLLIERGYTLTLPQIEQVVEFTENGGETGISIDGINGYGSFFFTETGDERNPISVVRVDRGNRNWGANVRQLSRGTRWRTVHRLLVRNLDAGL